LDPSASPDPSAGSTGGSSDGPLLAFLVVLLVLCISLGLFASYQAFVKPRSQPARRTRYSQVDTEPYDDRDSRSY
jgi:hypothetical protein